MNLFPWLRKNKDPNYDPDRDIGIGRRSVLEHDYAFALPFTATVCPHGITRVAVMAHVYYPDLCQELLLAILHIPVTADLYISTDTEEKRDAIKKVVSSYRNGSVEVRVFPNRGRDIAPKIVGFADVYSRYEYFLHIHTKKTLFDDKLAGWRSYLLHNLLGSPEIVNSILTLLKRDEIGAVFPQHYEVSRPAVHWGHCFRRSRELLRETGIALRPTMPLEFPSGSMFWGKSAALRLLLERKLAFANFDEEAGQIDGTLAHVLEHSFLYFIEAAGYAWAKTATETTYPHPATLLSVTDESDVVVNLKKIHRPLLLETPDPQTGVGRIDVREVTEIAYKVVKQPEDPTGQDVVLLTTYHSAGHLSRHILHMIAAYRAAGLKVLLLSVVDSLETAAPPSPPDGVDGYIIRKNHGYDFSVWAHALKIFPQLYQARMLIFANDSVFGPLDQHDFDLVMEKIRASETGLIALTDSNEISPHYQSYFLACKNQSDTFTKLQPFWDKVRSIAHKKTVISQYEFTLQPFAVHEGVHCKALFPVAEIKNRHFQGNPTLLLWKKLIEKGFPFVKVQLVRDALPGTTTSGLDVILRRKGYDSTIIPEHLAGHRTAGR